MQITLLEHQKTSMIQYRTRNKGHEMAYQRDDKSHEQQILYIKLSSTAMLYSATVDTVE